MSVSTLGRRARASVHEGLVRSIQVVLGNMILHCLWLLMAVDGLRLSSGPPPMASRHTKGVVSRRVFWPVTAAAFTAASATVAAEAMPVPDGCVWNGEGDYPGKKAASRMPGGIKGMNKDLDCASPALVRHCRRTFDARSIDRSIGAALSGATARKEAASDRFFA